MAASGTGVLAGLDVVRTKAYPTTKEGIAQFYDEWATQYDGDLDREGYHGSEICVEALEKVLMNKDNEIVDMACGTGRAAEALTKLGYKFIDGVDISPKSLKIAEEKGIYRRLICDSIGTNTLDIKDDTYDAMILSGGLAFGHLNQDCFPELMRVVKPGGFIIFNIGDITMNTFDRFKDGKLDSDMQELAQKGLWEMVSHEIVSGFLFNQTGHLYTIKVL